jgi:peptidoglycan/xylan/chitin deacetylase (PgdA/CDA1 family)
VGTRGRRRSAIAGAVALAAGLIGWALPASTASATDPVPIVLSPITVVTIGFDDGTADQFAARIPLHEHGMNATFFINSGPIAAGDPDHMTVEDLGVLAGLGNEIGGHTVDHANIQPLSEADATHEVCDDRAQLTAWGVEQHFPAPTSFAYPFGSWDATSETIVQGCGYDSARTVSGVSIHVAKGKIGETIPPADPYATRTPPNPKKATKLATMKQYVINAEAGVASSGQSLWIQFVFHRYCDAHCGAYTIQPDKFTKLLDFLYAEEHPPSPQAPRVTVLTTAQAMALGANPVPQP